MFIYILHVSKVNSLLENIQKINIKFDVLVKYYCISCNVKRPFPPNEKLFMKNSISRNDYDIEILCILRNILIISIIHYEIDAQ